MDAQIVVVVVGLIVTAIAAYRVGHGGSFHYVDAIEPLRDAAYLVEKFAPAADQLVKLGDLDKDDRKDYVISLVLSTLKGVSWSQVEAVLEAWVVESKQPKAGE